MKYLLDLNVLVALGFLDHEFHQVVARWVSTLTNDSTLVTCSLTDLAFIRLLAQIPAYGVDVVEARRLLHGAKSASPVPFEFIADDHDVAHLPDWVTRPKQVNDGHLTGLAKAKEAVFVTMDRGIPGAFLIPLDV